MITIGSRGSQLALWQANEVARRLAHEIRNPLNAIGLNAELLQEELEGSPSASREAVQLVAAISREVDRLNGVAEEYLRFARLPRPQVARQDLTDILGSLLDFLGPELCFREFR